MVSLVSRWVFLWLAAAFGLAGCGGGGGGGSGTTTPPVTTPTTLSAPVNLAPGTLVAPYPTLAGWSGQLTWSAVSGATSYKVAVRDLASNALVVDASSSTNALAANLVNAAPKQYSWTVSACNADGCSASSSAAFFNTVAAVPTPDVPTNPVPGDPGSYPLQATSSISFGWDAMPGATSYTVLVTTVATNAVSRSTATTNSLKLDLAASTQYQWTVQACNASGCSAVTAALTFQTSGAPPMPTTTVTGIAGGANTSFAIKSDGTLWAWGANGKGQLGDGTVLQRSAPVLVGSNYGAVASNAANAVALRSDATLWTWGAGGALLGDATIAERHAPVKVGTGYKQVALGASSALAVKTDNTLWAWGKGYLGDGKNAASQTTPLQVGSSFASVSAGQGNAVGIDGNGGLWVWGAYTTATQSCDPLANAAALATPLLIGTAYTATASNGNNSFAVAANGDLYGCGDNSFGQLGLGGTAAIAYWMNIGSGFQAVAAGLRHTLALKTDGSLWAWGDNSLGAVGDGSGVNRASPVLVGTGFIAIAAGDTHSLAVKADGTLWAWGSNASGELGDGGTVNRLSPVQVGF
jgi:alpha-tubulin suppressor-like RCC1 family protein